MQILAAKLAERQREEHQAELAALTGPQSDVAWGSQIRSYVIAPYQLVKDLRTGYETGNVDAVLDGDLDELWSPTFAGGARNKARDASPTAGGPVAALSGLWRPRW